MKQKFKPLLLYLFLVSLCSVLSAQSIEKSALEFVKKCSSCHTIGNPDSDLDGPDLADALKYSDAELDEAFDSMEEEIEEKISAELRAGYTAFFRTDDPVSVLNKAIEASENLFGEGLEAGDVVRGKSLYNGSEPFKNGAVSCMSCHDQFGKDALGGSLGPSLVGLYDKMGKTRLFNGIRSSKYKVMKHVYGDQKVTDQEAVHLTTYFESVKGEPASVGIFSFIGYGVVFGLIMLGMLAFVYRNRLRDEY